MYSKAVTASFAALLSVCASAATPGLQVHAQLEQGLTEEKAGKACFEWTQLDDNGRSGASDPVETCSVENVDSDDIAKANAVLKRAGFNSAAVQSFILTQPLDPELNRRYHPRFTANLEKERLRRASEYMTSRAFSMQSLISFAAQFKKSPVAHAERMRQIQAIDGKIEALLGERAEIQAGDK